MVIIIGLQSSRRFRSGFHELRGLRWGVLVFAVVNLGAGAAVNEAQFKGMKCVTSGRIARSRAGLPGIPGSPPFTGEEGDYVGAVA